MEIYLTSFSIIVGRFFPSANFDSHPDFCSLYSFFCFDSPSAFNCWLWIYLDFTLALKVNWRFASTSMDFCTWVSFLRREFWPFFLNLGENFSLYRESNDWEKAFFGFDRSFGWDFHFSRGRVWIEQIFYVGSDCLFWLGFFFLIPLRVDQAGSGGSDPPPGPNTHKAWAFPPLSIKPLFWPFFFSYLVSILFFYIIIIIIITKKILLFQHF